MKKILLLFIILLAAGCMDYNELNDIGIVTMMEISYKNNQYDVTLEMLNTNKNVDESSYFIKGTGKTFEEAINNCKSQSYLKPNFSHMYVAILDENIINNKLNNIYDYLIRDIEIKKDFIMLTSNDIEKINSFDNINTISIGEYIYKINKNQRSNSPDYFTNNFREIVHSILNNTTYYIGSISIENNNFIFDHVYLIDKNKKVLKIDNESLLLYLLLYNEIKSFELNGNVSLTVYKYKPDIKITRKEIIITITMDTKLSNIYDNKIFSYSDLNKIEKHANAKLKERFEKSISYSINNYDLYGIDRLYYNKYPKLYKKNIYKKLKYKVVVKTNVDEKGLTFKAGGK